MKYRIRFWFNTDLRAEEVVESMNTVNAFVAAHNNVMSKSAPADYEWCNAPGFRVEIERAQVS